MIKVTQPSHNFNQLYKTRYLHNFLISSVFIKKEIRFFVISNASCKDNEKTSCKYLIIKQVSSKI